MKKVKIEKTVFNSIFSESWRKEHTHSNGRFTKDAIDCKRMIRELGFWKFYRFLSIFANLSCLIGGAILLYAAKDSTIVFRLFGAMWFCVQALLGYNIFWLTKGEGHPDEEAIPGKTARQLASAWDAFLKEVKKTDLLKEMTQWSKTTGQSYFGYNEMFNFFKYILKKKGHLIEDLEAAGKEERRKLERERMSVIYSIAQALEIHVEPFASYFPSSPSIIITDPERRMA